MRGRRCAQMPAVRPPALCVADRHARHDAKFSRLLLRASAAADLRRLQARCPETPIIHV